MKRFIPTVALFLGVVSHPSHAGDAPSYAKHIRPILAKYCLECHNPKSLKGGLDLESFRGILEGGNKGVVLVPGDPDKSRLLTMTEGTAKPVMPPKTAKHHPKKEDLALLRAWVKAGAKDDSGLIKVALPAIEPHSEKLPPVAALAYDPRGLHVAVGSGGSLWFYSTDKLTNGSGSESTDIVTAACYSSDGVIFAQAHGTPGEWGKVKLRGSKSPYWSFTKFAASPKHKDVILDLAISPDKKWLASASYDTQVQIAPIEAGELIILKDHSDAVYGLAFSPDSKQLATCSADRAVKIWDAATGKLLLTLGEANDWLYSVAWSVDGKLAAGGLDKSIRLYDVSDGKAKLLHSVFAHEGGVQKVLFSKDGSKLYSLGQDAVAKAWKTSTMQELRTYAKQPENVLCLAVSPDDKQLALGRYDGVVVLLDEASGKTVRELKPVGVPKKGKTEGKKDAKKEMKKVEPPPDPFPLQKEGAGNDSAARGTMIKLPATASGTLERAGDADFFRFEAKKGQQLGIQAVTAAMGSKVEPFLQLFNARGDLVAQSTNGLIGHVFDADGVYALGIRDIELRGGGDMTYKVNIGDLPIVTSVFPLGLPRGQEREFQVRGVFLDQASVKLKAADDAAPGSKLALPITSKHGKVLGNLQVTVGEFPDTTADPKAGETPTLPVPGAANGRIDTPGAVDLWRFAAKKGERLVLEIEAARLGSPLDSMIEILDAKKEPVARAVLRCQAKTYVTFRDHNDVQGNIRIDAWNDLAVNDFIYVGGELLKIQALPTHPDADCNFFTAGGLRTGFLDTTPTHHAMNDPMYKVSIHPPGSTFPPNGFPVFTLLYRNDDGGSGFGRDSRLFFDPPGDGEYLVRISDAKGAGGPAHAYRLTVRPPRPGFTVRLSPDNPSVWRGGSIPVTVSADRIDGYDGPIQVRLENLPPGFHAPTTDIEAGLNSTTFALFAEDSVKTPDKGSFKVIAEATIGGKKMAREAVGQAPKVMDPGEIVTRTVESEITLKPGGITTLTVKIERRDKFTGRVPLEVRGLPHGVRVLDIGLNGILITESETRRTIQIYAEPWVEATNHPIVVLAKREGKNGDYGAKSVLLKIAK